MSSLQPHPPLSFETLSALDILAVIRDHGTGQALGLLCEDKAGTQYELTMDEVREFQKVMRVISGFQQKLE